MSRDLGPKLGYFPEKLHLGALIALPVDKADSDSPTETLMFQFNPEEITRTRSGEWKSRKDWRNRGARNQSEIQELSQQGSASLLARSEIITMKVVFDATEGILAGRENLSAYGILPELAALELITIGNESVEASRDKAPKNRVRPVRPHEVLLVLGQRVFPVVLTNITITEQRFSPALVPLRAQCDLKMRVLEPFEAKYNTRIATEFATLQKERQKHREMAITDFDVLEVMLKAISTPTPSPDS